MKDPKLSKGDAAAWKHAMESGQIHAMAPMLTNEEQQHIVLVALYTWSNIDKKPGGVPEAELGALLDWARRARIHEQMLQGMLNGSLYVRMGADGEPLFSLTRQGEVEARRIAREVGLPVPDEETGRDGGT